MVAVNLVVEKTLYHDNNGSLCFDDILVKNKRLLCYGGVENLASFQEDLSDDIGKNFPFNEAKDYSFPEKSKKHVFFAASNPNNDIIGAITHTSSSTKCIELCDKSFMSSKDIKMKASYLKPTKIYYTPDGKYLVVLTYYSWYSYDDSRGHKKFVIKIIDPSNGQIVSSYKIDHRIPKHSDFRYAGPEKTIDYLLIPDNQHIVYISDCFDSEYYSYDHYGKYYFEILRLNQQTLDIEKIDNFKNEEALYQILAQKLRNENFVRPLYIDVKNGFFLLHVQPKNCIKKFSLTEQKFSKKLYDAHLFESHGSSGNQIALFPNTYFAFYDYKKEMIQLFNFNLEMLAETKAEICDNVQFSDNGKKLIATNSKKTTIFNIE